MNLLNFILPKQSLLGYWENLKNEVYSKTHVTMDHAPSATAEKSWFLTGSNADNSG